MNEIDKQVRIQRDYYARTAESYDELHCAEHNEHDVALDVMVTFVQRYNIGSVLDIGAGTGRVAFELARRCPGLDVTSLEPSPELRARAVEKGLGGDAIIDGDAQALAFDDNAFDLVCEFATLHHIPKPDMAIDEMLRVANIGVFVSDNNIYGSGAGAKRWIKQQLRRLGLWQLAFRLKTNGKGYVLSEGDGLYYSYSVFDDLPRITAQCRNTYLMNTDGCAANIWRYAPHVCVFGAKS